MDRLVSHQGQAVCPQYEEEVARAKRDGREPGFGENCGFLGVKIERKEDTDVIVRKITFEGDKVEET